MKRKAFHHNSTTVTLCSIHNHSFWQQHQPFSLSRTLTLSSLAPSSILPLLNADRARQSVLSRYGRRICIEEKKGPGISAACLMCCTDRLNQSCQTLLGTGWFYMACFITVPAGPGRSYCPHDDCPAQLSTYWGFEARHAICGAGSGPNSGRVWPIQ